MPENQGYVVVLSNGKTSTKQPTLGHAVKWLMDAVDMNSFDLSTVTFKRKPC